jgi:RHS repeat-associated protein
VLGLATFGGSVLKTYKYDAFGNIKQETGPTINRGFTYTSRERHARSGLYYYRARWYSPTLGRFLSQDPIGHLGGVNLYAYVGNNPVEYTDPFGLTWLRFERSSGTLYVYPGTEDTQGPPQAFPAGNKVSSGFSQWPNGTYDYSWYSPHKRDRDENGSYGLYGNFIFEVPNHEGMGVHSGRANDRGPEHPTQGCIRTTDQAMEKISGYHFGGDPLIRIIVE